MESRDGEQIWVRPGLSIRVFWLWWFGWAPYELWRCVYRRYTDRWAVYLQTGPRMVSKLSRPGVWPDTHSETTARTPNRPSFDPALQAVRPQESLGSRRSRTENMTPTHGCPRQSTYLPPHISIGVNSLTYRLVQAISGRLYSPHFCKQTAE